jgi:hypothetical protein
MATPGLERCHTKENFGKKEIDGEASLLEHSHTKYESSRKRAFAKVFIKTLPVSLSLYLGTANTNPLLRNLAHYIYHMTKVNYFL